MNTADLELNAKIATGDQFGSRAHHPDALPQRGGDARGLYRQGAGVPAARGVSGEVLVADNGSTDGSQEIAAARARAWCRSRAAATAPRCIGGIAAARGRFVIMGDADDSYDFADLMPSSSGCAAAPTW